MDRINLTDLLIIDDDKDLCYLITQILEPYQMEIITVSTLAEAEFYLSSTTVKNILLDYHGADGNAVQYVRRMKKTEPLVKVFVTSNSNTREFQKEAMANGAHAFIPKPFSYQQVIDLGMMAGGKKKLNGQTHIEESN